MASDETSLLLRIRGDASGGKVAVSETRQALNGLRVSATNDLKAIQTASTTSLGSIVQASGVLNTNLPIVGQTVSNLSTSFNTLTTATQGSKASIAGVAGAVVVAVAALGSLASAAVGAVQGIAGLARETAEFQGKLFDLSQQTGVSVETLSALEVIARTTGSSIESLVASLGIFQKNLEESLDTNSKAAEAFRRLGVEVTNTEDTFRATLQSLAKMPEGFRQTALALELFGRGGKSVLAVLKETNGDIDATIEKLRGLGLVTTEQARKADQFNDQLVLLQVALRGLGSEAIPHVSDALVKLQKTIDENKGAVDFLKAAIGFLAGSLALQLETAVKTGESVWKSHRTEVNLVVEAYQILRNAIRGTVAEIPKITLPTPGGESGLELLRFLKQFGVPLTEKQDFSKIKGLFNEDPTKGLSEAQARAARSLALQQSALEERTRVHREALERERELDLKSIDAWETESEALADEHRESQEKILDQELANARRFIKDREDLLLAETDIQQRRTKLANDTARELERIDDEAQRRRDQSILRVESQLLAIEEERRRGQLEIIQRALDEQAITEAEALTRQLEVLREAHDQRLVLIQAELDLLTTSAERKIELDNLKIESEQRFTNETKRLSEERKAARERELAAQAPGAQGIPEQRGPLDILPGLKVPEAEINNLDQALTRLGETLGRLLGASDDFGKQFSQVLGSAIDSFAFGVGDLVHQWVLLGETGPAAMRKLTASVLAGLAAQAAVKSVFQLAEGFAALFFNPAEAAAHFTSAAIFASIAGIAAIAGRAIAGDLFQSKPNSGGGGAGSPRPLNTVVEQGRNQRESPLTIHVDIKHEEGVIVRTWADDFGNGGITRQTFDRDGR